MKELIKSISGSEKRFLFLMTVALLLITTLPYVLGYFLAPEGRFYNGLHALSPGDVPIYYSYINQVKGGDFLVKDLFTSEVQDLGGLNVWWFLVGVFAKIFNLSPILAFHLSRIFMVPVIVFTGYLFLAYFFKSIFQRKIALIFLFFSSGVGFYFAAPLDVLNIEGLTSYLWPIDLWLTEATTFNAVYQSSHFIGSLVLMLLIFLLMLKFFEKDNLRLAVIGGALALFYFNFHPYYLPVIYGVLGLYLFLLMLQAKKFLWKKSYGLLILVGLSLPSAFYHFWLIKKSTVVGFRALQNITTIPTWPFVAMGYGFLWLGLGLGVYFLVKNKKFNNKYAFLLIWLTVNVLLIYSPFPFHSRYTQGLHVILVIFTVTGLFDLYQFLKKKISDKRFNFWINSPALWLILFLILFSTSVLYSVGRDIKFFVQPGEKTLDKLFLPQDFKKATEYLSIADFGVVLAADIPSKFIPGYSGQTVYAAHAHETLFHSSKIVYVLMFYADNDNGDFKQKFLADNNIKYVLFSEYEKKLGNFDPSFADFLTLVVDSREVKLYEFISKN